MSGRARAANLRAVRREEQAAPAAPPGSSATGQAQREVTTSREKLPAVLPPPSITENGICRQEPPHVRKAMLSWSHPWMDSGSSMQTRPWSIHICWGQVTVAQLPQVSAASHAAMHSAGSDDAADRQSLTHLIAAFAGQSQGVANTS
jgi:hypothetical protein